LLGHSLLQIIRFSPVAIILPLLHTHFHLHVALTRVTNGGSLRTFQKQCYFANLGALARKYFHSCYSSQG